MAIYWLAQAQSPWWEAMRLGFWSWQPVVVFFLNFLSLTIAIAAFMRAGRTDKRSQLRARIFAKIAAIRDDAERITMLVEQNLLGTAELGSLEKSHQQISVALKQLQIKVHELEVALPWKQEAVFRAYNTWNNVLTGDGYPVLRKANAFKAGDARIANVLVAQTQLVSSLSQIEDDCIRETVPFWKHHPSKPALAALPPRT